MWSGRVGWGVGGAMQYTAGSMETRCLITPHPGQSSLRPPDLEALVTSGSTFYCHVQDRLTTSNGIAPSSCMSI